MMPPALASGERPVSDRLADLAGASSNDEVALEAGIFEPQNLRQSAVAFHVGGETSCRASSTNQSRNR
jgi:hypothetical protein